MYEHNALGYWSGLALCLTKVRSSRARCPATALIYLLQTIEKKNQGEHAEDFGRIKLLYDIICFLNSFWQRD